MEGIAGVGKKVDTITAKMFSAKFRSKREIWNFLSVSILY